MSIPYWLVVLVVGVAATFFAVVAIGALGVAVDRFGCERSWRDSGREWRFERGLCQVHDGKGWVPASSVRVP